MDSSKNNNSSSVVSSNYGARHYTEDLLGNFSPTNTVKFSKLDTLDAFFI